MIRRERRGRRPRWQELREKRGRGIFLLPSLLTTGNLFCGFLALIMTDQDRYREAALAIFVAMVMDMLDGRVARLMKATSQFGVEFDSLADVVSFCVAPAFLLYSFALSNLELPAWIGVAFLFAICGALRLARFNVHTGTVDRRFFIGLPTPAAAGTVAATVILIYGETLDHWMLVGIGVGTLVTALLMVSTFRYWSFKEIEFVRRHPLQTLLGVVVGVIIVAVKYQLFLFILFVGYALSGPVLSRRMRKLIAGRAPAAVSGEAGTNERL